uniref:Ionotropic receptor n=1 Tax=Anoplophora chinensis TaxID=217632 RepID=A0A2H4ZBE6_ANOCN|nr:ionotropic receptor [Anoplophora chinensis]
MTMIWLLILLPVIMVLPGAESKKVIPVAIFVDDDDHFEVSTVAIASAMRRVNLVQMTNYFLKPYIYEAHRRDILNIEELVSDLMKKGIAAIFGPESPEINEIIQSVSTTLQIPQFQTFWNPKLSSYSGRLPPDESIQIFNLYPSPQTLSKALATLLKINDWSSFTVIYEDDDGLLKLQEALKQRNPKDPAISFRKLGPSDNHRSVLKEIKNTGVLNFILDCKTDHILDILREAREHKLLSEYHSYILTNLDTHTLDWPSFKDIKSNITSFRLINTTSHITGTVVEWNMLLNYSILDTVRSPAIQKELDRFRIRYPYPAIKAEAVRVKSALLYDALNLFLTVFGEQDAKEELELTPVSYEEFNISWHGLHISNAIKEKKFYSGVLLRPLTGPITEFTSWGQRLNCELEVVELTKQKFRTIAVWNSETGDKVHFAICSECRQKQVKEEIQGKNFRVISKLGPPYLMMRPNPEGNLMGNDRFEGYAMDLMKEICKPENLNCSYTFRLVDDGHYGNRDSKTKKWNGLIKEILELKADLAVCDLTITYERRTAVDFTLPFMTLGISILHAKAVKEPPELLSFSHPLSLDVWLYMATSYVVISMIIFLVARLNPNDWENPHPCEPCPRELENIWNMKNCLWLTLGSIMAQGCDILPKGISTRMVTSMWWFFSLIITACYTANLAAFLTMERMGPTIESAEDLAAQNKIKYGCVSGGATEAFFKDTNFSTYHRMWVQMESAEPTVFETGNPEGVKRVLNSKRQYAFLMESSSIEYQTERNCELMQVGNTLDSKGYGIAMPTNARYRKAINEVILRLQEMGFLLKLKNRWWKEKNGGGQCKEDKHSDEEAATELGLDHVGGVFVVLAAGVCIALVIAVCEFLWSVRKVVVVEHLTLKEAFQKELRFALDIWARKKATLCPPSIEKSLR